MSDNRERDALHIKKYPNRRYYDTTRSRHVTLQEVHDIIMSGKDVFITDSRTEEDITNIVLTQILLEKDPPKLDIFPTSMFLFMIRGNRQVLRSFLEPFFGPFLGVFASSQRQFDNYWRQAVSGKLNPMDWAQSMVGSFPGGPAGEPEPNGRPSPVEDDWAPSPEHSPPADHNDLDDLRRQVAALTKKIEEMGSKAEGGHPFPL